MGSMAAFKILWLSAATSAASFREGASASHGEARPQYEAAKASKGSQLHGTPAKAGVHCTNDGGLVIARHVKTTSQGRAMVNTWTGTARKAVIPRTLAPPPGLPARPPPGFVPTNQTEVVTQVVLGHVQAMFERFTESFKRRLMQRD